jgi:hypothetical protein
MNNHYATRPDPFAGFLIWVIASPIKMVPVKDNRGSAHRVSALLAGKLESLQSISQEALRT